MYKKPTLKNKILFFLYMRKILKRTTTRTQIGICNLPSTIIEREVYTYTIENKTILKLLNRNPWEVIVFCFNGN